MTQDDAVRLRHMLDAAAEAISFANGRTRADLDADRQLVLAPQIPWAEIIGMRHRLVHAYFDINLDVLWQTVQANLPSLAAALESVVPPQP